MIFQLFTLAFTGIFIAFGIAAVIGHVLLLKALLIGVFGAASEPAPSYAPLLRFYPAA
jgi:hypothetical protein